MNEEEKAAKAEITKFVDDWFDRQVELRIAEPESYAGCTKDDWVLWFFESDGTI